VKIKKRDGAIDINLAYHKEIWFDLEVINALALDEWESSGMSENWISQWDKKISMMLKKLSLNCECC
jgi:hypothetical protein